MWDMSSEPSLTELRRGVLGVEVEVGLAEGFVVGVGKTGVKELPLEVVGPPLETAAGELMRLLPSG